MDKELRILFVEDVPADAVAVERVLRGHGLAVNLQRVDTRDEFVRQLESAQPPDVILSDHGLPSFDGFSALALAHEKCPDTPFIFVTNALNWDMDIDKLAPGVSDFVQKRHLDVLAPAVRRALFHAGNLRQHKIKLEEQREMVSRLVTLLAEYEAKGGYLPICANCKKIRDNKDSWRPPEEFFTARIGLKFTHGICPDCTRKFYGL